MINEQSHSEGNKMTTEKYVSRIVNLIYQDSKGIITKRLIRVYSVQHGIVRVYDMEKKAFRSIRVNGILAIQPVIKHAS